MCPNGYSSFKPSKVKSGRIVCTVNKPPNGLMVLAQTKRGETDEGALKRRSGTAACLPLVFAIFVVSGLKSRPVQLFIFFLFPFVLFAAVVLSPCAFPFLFFVPVTL